MSADVDTSPATGRMKIYTCGGGRGGGEGGGWGRGQHEANQVNHAKQWRDVVEKKHEANMRQTMQKSGGFGWFKACKREVGHGQKAELSKHAAERVGSVVAGDQTTN